jgi:hypothetical protein
MTKNKHKTGINISSRDKIIVNSPEVNLAKQDNSHKLGSKINLF